MAPHFTSSQMFWVGLALVAATLLGIVMINAGEGSAPASESGLWLWVLSGSVLNILQTLGIVLIGAGMVTRVIEHYNGD